MRTLFAKIAQRFWTHEVRPEGVGRRRRRINPPSPPKCERPHPGPFAFSPSEVWAFEPYSTNVAALAEVFQPSAARLCY